MSDTTNELTVDEAVAEFMKAAREIVETLPPDRRSAPSPRTFEEAEAQHFRFAEILLRQLCPDPRACIENRCRRDRLCQHIVNLRVMQRAPNTKPFSRRSPGIFALRHAIWLYTNRFMG